MKIYLSIIFLIVFNSQLVSQETTYETIASIPYYNSTQVESDSYIAERCHLDLYYPKTLKDYPIIVWFHGGGLTGGEKFIPESLKEKEVAIVAVNYRLSPRAQAKNAIEDAAAAVSWVFKNIETYGGDPSLIFVSGHSAGGYLTSMIGLDRSYLQQHAVNADDIAGLIPFSGHTITHLTIRKEQGISEKQPIIDAMSPLYHIRPDAPPMLLITGDRELEMLGRYEENAYFWRMMKLNGHQSMRLYELDGFDHGGMAYPAFPLLLKEVKTISKQH